MELTRHTHKPYIKIDFEFLDCGILAFLPPPVLKTYLVLRRHLWRSQTSGRFMQRQAYQRGLLAASISYLYLGKQCGVSRRSAFRHVKELRKLGMLRTVNPAHVDPTYTGPALFVLGEWLTTAHGPLEYLYADALTTQAFDKMTQLVQDRKLEHVTQLDLQTRLAIVTTVFVSTDPESAETDDEDDVLSAEETEIVKEWIVSGPAKTGVQLPAASDNNEDKDEHDAEMGEEALKALQFDKIRNTEETENSGVTPPMTPMSLGGDTSDTPRCHPRHPVGVRSVTHKYIKKNREGTNTQNSNSTRAGRYAPRPHALEDLLTPDNTGQPLQGAGPQESQPAVDDRVADDGVAEVLVDTRYPVDVNPEPRAGQGVLADREKTGAKERVAQLDALKGRLTQGIREEQARLQEKAAMTAQRKAAAGINREKAKTVGVERYWISLLRQIYSEGTFSPWDVKTRVQVERLLEAHGEEGVKAGMMHLLYNWTHIRDRWKLRGLIPAIGLLVKFGDTLINEGRVFATVPLDVMSEWTKIKIQGPYTTVPPELEARYAREVLPKLRTLGLAR